MSYDKSTTVDDVTTALDKYVIKYACDKELVAVLYSIVQVLRRVELK